MPRVAVLLVAIVTLAPRVSAALDPPPWVAYDCPGFENPRQCFHDVDADGCFGAGDEIVAMPMQASILSGGLVCPPGTRPIDVVATAEPFEQWGALGNVRFHGTVINLAPGVILYVTAGFGVSQSITARVVLDGVKIRGGEGAQFWGAATRGAHFGGSATFSPAAAGTDDSWFVVATSSHPDLAELTVADGSRIAAGAVWVSAGVDPGAYGSRDIKVRLGRKVRIEAFGAPTNTLPPQPDVLISCGAGGVEAENLRIRAQGIIRMASDGPMSLRGRSMLHANGRDGDLVVESTTGDVTIDRVVVRADSSLAMTGDLIRIGGPDDQNVRRSSVRGGIRTTFEARAALDLERVDLKAHRIVMTTDGTAVDFRNSIGRGFGAASTLTLTTGSGAICDFTGSKLLKLTLSENCGSLIGP